jgi:hypothetical protein
MDMELIKAINDAYTAYKNRTCSDAEAAKLNHAYQSGWDDCLEVTANAVYRDFNIRIPINK